MINPSEHQETPCLCHNDKQWSPASSLRFPSGLVNDLHPVALEPPCKGVPFCLEMAQSEEPFSGHCVNFLTDLASSSLCKHHCLSHFATGQQGCLDHVAPACGLHLIMPALDAPVVSAVTEKAVHRLDDATQQQTENILFECFLPWNGQCYVYNKLCLLAFSSYVFSM